MERDDIDALAERCREAPGEVMSGLLARLATRRRDLAAALQGEPLRVLVRIDAGTQVARHWFLLTPDGHVAVHACLQHDVEIAGAAGDVLAFLSGELELGDAVERGVVRLTDPVALAGRLRPFLGVIADEIA